ncbi:SMP-30/gluconolactonase/LRE family protein [Shimia sagamensis]|uniref:Sugar lactone lactonase YvrE n=1 Tax=Shimia sagamensis TaxID=1566352 RepID=A0ABY1P5M7_9RHOB|nr:SMP-30/gluconolactonase/LRE family protein [Shimia sagamensis]SMP26525.1 Sugar lactone lactonase YvrE [Shimia sagamensis]
MSIIFDDRPCALGEGPLWHPERKQLFWFDIVGKRMMSQADGEPLEWQFDEHVSAAGWVDQDTLILASETGLWKFYLDTEEQEYLCSLEADNPVTRSNDGRADPWGGFWIGTMGKNAERKAGAIYRYFDGALRKLVSNVTISNAICFDKERGRAYYTDTLTKLVMRQGLDAETGWPIGKAEVYLGLNEDGLNPDGAVVDAEGNVWIAQWGAARVAAYDPEGNFLKSVAVGGQHSSCPAFGGDDLTTLFVTSAREGIDEKTLAETPQNGMVFAIDNAAQGVAEPRVIL